MILRGLPGLVLIASLTGGAEAGPGEGSRALATLRSADVTVSAGAVLPLLLLFEYPGPAAAVTLAWRLTERTQLVASVDIGGVHADGRRRYLGSLGVGVRASPWQRGPLWAQLGLGTTGFVERIGVVLPDRMVRATDVGAALTTDLALGVRVARWEVAIGYDHIVWPRHYYQVYGGSAAVPFRGTGMVWVGRQL